MRNTFTVATFGLVHGAWHGGWCWELLEPELRKMGHMTVAVDLPCEDPSAGFDDYAEVVAQALGGADEVVLVGHSLAGMTIPRVALRRPIARLIFLCAVVPERAGFSNEGEPASNPPGAFDALVRHPDGSNNWPAIEAAAPVLYQDCDSALALGAFRRLRRQQTAMWNGLLPMTDWPDVPVTSIHCADDRTVSPAWSQWAATTRLGVETVTLPGGHSPMLSRPAALATALNAASSA